MDKNKLMGIIREYFSRIAPDHDGEMELLDAAEYYGSSYKSPDVDFVVITEGNEFDVATAGDIVRLGPCGCDLHMIQTIG